MERHSGSTARPLTRGGICLVATPQLLRARLAGACIACTGHRPALAAACCYPSVSATATGAAGDTDTYPKLDVISSLVTRHGRRCNSSSVTCVIVISSLKAAVFNLLPWCGSRAAGAGGFRRVSLCGSGVRRPNWDLVALGGNCRAVSALLLKSSFFCLWDTTLSALVAVEDTMSVLDYC
ncbi:hypothetical protein GUJ93_ZPchr0006g45666 [Zizania palustris]|uniref:Uncharacterized protein n=1 Tax=Zizania palustris TaxID=103762 RepID=A0A8J5W460_ZIZPA|nr:hypothetical protein GUJ93_ZPchr0006g45666 [Zizania palustris]